MRALKRALGDDKFGRYCAELASTLREVCTKLLAAHADAVGPQAWDGRGDVDGVVKAIFKAIDSGDTLGGGVASKTNRGNAADGKVTAEELEEGLRRHGCGDLDDAQMKMLLMHFDADGDNSIDEDEFMDTAKAHQIYPHVHDPESVRVAQRELPDQELWKKRLSGDEQNEQ